MQQSQASIIDIVGSVATFDTKWIIGDTALASLAQDFNRLFTEDDRANVKDGASRSR